MRRAFGEKPVVGRAGPRFQLAAVAIVLAVMAPTGAKGDGPSPNQPDGRGSADNGAAAGPPADASVRRVDTRPHGGLGSALSAPSRHPGSDACIRRAYAAVVQRDFERVVAESTEAIRIDPWEAEAYYLRGTARDRMNQTDLALADLSESIRIEPGVANAYTIRGGIWAKKGEYEKALADLTEAIRLGPRGAMAYNNRGGVWV